MRLPPLERATLLRRYKRFLADVLFDDGREETVHCPNPGAMLGLNQPGQACRVSRSTAKARKLPGTLEFVQERGGAWVGVNTAHPNRLAAEALASGAIPELAGYATVRPEVRYGEASRVDFLLEALDRPPCWLEVKGVTLSRTPGLAEWPDCVSARASRHLGELAARVRLGERAAVLFIAQRDDCDRLAPAADLDPAFAAALARARGEGVEALAYGCEVSEHAITVARRIEA
jgi:sugar fermentation stimulation protein A